MIATRRHAAPMTPEIAAALRLPLTEGKATGRRFPSLDRRDRRFAGTRIVSRWRISLPFDDRLLLG